MPHLIANLNINLAWSNDLVLGPTQYGFNINLPQLCHTRWGNMFVVSSIIKFWLRDKYMRIKVALLFWLILLVLSSHLSVSAAPIDEWQKLMLDGSTNKFDGQYNIALQSFSKAVALAQKEKLPAKCLPIALCRVAAVEVITNRITKADIHLKRVVDLMKQQKDAGILDPQVSFWAAALSEEYMSNTKPENREICLRHACYLKGLVYGGTHRECLDCLNKLAGYYIDQNKMDKAIHFLTVVQSIMDTKYGKKPDALGETFNILAIKCRLEHKYDQAKQLELAVIKMANESIGDLRAGLPAFYSFLGMNALAQGKAAECTEYFHKALAECSKIRGLKNRKLAAKYVDLLIAPSSLDIHQAKLGVAKTELKHILTMEQMLALSKDSLYAPYTLLADAVICDPSTRTEEYVGYLNNAIAIAELPNSCFAKDIPDLYLRLGLANPIETKFKYLKVAFPKALEAEKDKHGFHATLVLFWWGWQYFKIKNTYLATQKLDTALKQATALPSANRGTLLADVLQTLAQIAWSSNKVEMGQSFANQSANEIQLQKKLNSKLGPDFYHRL